MTRLPWEIEADAEPFDISRQLDDEGELLPHIYNGSSKYVAIDAAWKREEEMIAENRNYVEEPEDAAAAAAAVTHLLSCTQMMRSCRSIWLKESKLTMT